MLVLTRKAMETIKIGNDVVIKVICTGTKSVRIGIEAPDHVRILRGELSEYPAVKEPTPEWVPPLVAEAVADGEAMEEPVVVGPMTADKFLANFEDDLLPGRSIRRMLEAHKAVLKTQAK